MARIDFRPIHDARERDGGEGILNRSVEVRPNGSIKKVKGTFTGVVMGGSGYGTVVVSGEGSWGVKIAVCGSCND